jgi:isopentenyl diphosphate isomerase/L-lactate dehydrogenase-like FMN-dependent dehydrogenase
VRVACSTNEDMLRAARRRLVLRPRVLVAVSSVDYSTTVLGHRLRIPVMLAPRSCCKHVQLRCLVAASS